MSSPRLSWLGLLERQSGQAEGFGTVERNNVDSAERVNLDDAVILTVDPDDLSDLRLIHLFPLLLAYSMTRQYALVLAFAIGLGMKCFYTCMQPCIQTPI